MTTLAFTPLSGIYLAPKVARSLSSTSTTSTSSSTSSRTTDDVLERILSQEPNTTLHLWSAGNVRINGRDLTIPTADAHELLTVLGDDDRFEFLSIVYLDAESEEYKVSYRLSVSPASTPVSESE